MSRRQWIQTVVALLIMALGAGFLLQLTARQKLGAPGIKVTGLDGQRLRIELPERVGPYTSSNVEPAAIELQTLPKDTTFGRRLYTSPDGFQMMLSVVMMGTDRTSIHKPEYCLESQGWRIQKQEDDVLRLEHPHPYDLRIRKFTSSQVGKLPSGETIRASALYTFWFVSEKRLTGSHWSRVWGLTYDLLTTGVLPRWAYVSCLVVCPTGKEEAAYARVKQFLTAAVPEFQTAALPPAAEAKPAVAGAP